MTLPTFLPLLEAAEKFGLTEAELRQRVEAGTITAGKLQDGEIVVSEISVKEENRWVTKEEMPEYKRFEYLKNVPIGLGEASRKYGIPTPTISRWTKKKYIKFLRKDGQQKFINEQDVAYCALIYKQSGGQGKRLFNPDGTPYTPQSQTQNGRPKFPFAA